MVLDLEFFHGFDVFHELEDLGVGFFLCGLEGEVEGEITDEVRVQIGYENFLELIDEVALLEMQLLGLLEVEGHDIWDPAITEELFILEELGQVRAVYCIDHQKLYLLDFLVL